MSSNPTKPPGSIATQLILLFTLAAAVLLACALGGLYWLVVRHAFSEDNAVLADKIRELRAEMHEVNGLQSLTEELQNRHGNGPIVYAVRILGPHDEIEAETPGMEKHLPIAVFPSPAASKFSSPKDYRNGSRLFSLLSANENLDAKTYTIQIAQDRSEDEAFRRTFGVLLLLILPVGTLVFAIIAITVTRRGLRPLHRMARLVARVSPTHLNERLPKQDWPKEIQPLAVAFDDMLTRLEDSFTRLSQFSADLAHELRTPIANLLGEAQVVLSRTRKPEEYRQIIESSVVECERLAGIVNNLLFLARAEAAEGQLQPAGFDARTAIEKISAYYLPVAEERHIEILCNGKGQIFADPALFDRAVNNLIENALHFTPDGGQIGIAIDASATATQVSVKDTGSGIAQEHLPHVFDRFYRADPSRNSAGTGLGLALVKSIVELHGGSAKIESQVGGGTTVILSFPGNA